MLSDRDEPMDDTALTGAVEMISGRRRCHVPVIAIDPWGNSTPPTGPRVIPAYRISYGEVSPRPSPGQRNPEDRWSG